MQPSLLPESFGIGSQVCCLSLSFWGKEIMNVQVECCTATSAMIYEPGLVGQLLTSCQQSRQPIAVASAAMQNCVLGPRLNYALSQWQQQLHLPPYLEQAASSRGGRGQQQELATNRASNAHISNFNPSCGHFYVRHHVASHNFMLHQ